MNNAVNNIKLAVNIQHSPKRNRLLQHLLFSLDGFKPTNIIEDTVSCWSGCQKCLTTYPVGTTHILVMQDDVIACPDFIKTVKKIISILPDKPITFFCRDEIILAAKQRKQNFALLKVWFMAQAYVMPVAMAQDLVAWGNKHINPARTIDDENMAMYFLHHGIKVYATAPSLVDHLGWQSTTITDRDGDRYFDVNRRVARWFIGYDESGLKIKWDENLDDLPVANFGDWSMFCENYVE